MTPQEYFESEGYPPEIAEELATFIEGEGEGGDETS